MRNPWKRARAGGLSRLVSDLARPDHGASLVVQAGFPTSLADLVVKNRDRLKKPSRKKTPSSSSTRAPPVAAGEDAGSPAVRGSRGGAGGILEESPPYPVPSSIEIKTNASGSGFGLLVVNMLVLMALAIQRRKLVAGITVSAFAIFLLDFMGLQVFAFLKRCSNARRSLNSAIGGLDLEGRERVCPMREVGVEGHVDLIPSNRNWEESSIDSDQGREILSERRDLALGRNVGSSGNSKGKKFWRKFVLKKSLVSRKGKDEKKLISNSSSHSSRRGEFDSITEEDADEVINGKGHKKDSNEEVLSFIASTEVTDFDKEEIGDASREIVLKTRSGVPQQFVFFVIVLFGLAGGKTTAVILSVSWCLFIKLTETVRKR